jgi:serine-type D-Ala-D-Ala carboxypeptidase (penicillin-binding protein 5/6)
MHRDSFHLLVLLGLLLSSPAAHATTRSYTPEQVRNLVQARAALLIDQSTGRILYQRNIDAPYPPASTTKLMTALVVYETKGLGGTITVRSVDTRVQPSVVPLVAGETVPVIDLVGSMLIGSDNDAAMSLARYAGGNVDNFVQMMNARARSLGCTKTRFTNPHGLYEKGVSVTARDLRRIFDQAIAIPSLRRLCETKNYQLNTAKGPQIVKNHNKLLGLYPGMGPAKTGWTMASRHTYAASVSRDGRELHLIILNSPDKWKDATLLFDYGFENLPETSETIPELSNKT